MGEPGGPDDVTGGVDVRDVGLVAGVGLNVTAVGQLELLGVLWEDGGDPDSDETDFGFERLLLTTGGGLDRETDTVVGRLGSSRFGGGVEFDPVLRERLLERGTDFRVLDGEDAIHHLDDGHLGAVGAVEIGELDPDGAGSDDDHGLGLLLESHRVLRPDHLFPVEGKEGQSARDTTGREEDIRGRVDFAFSFGVDDLDFAVRGETAGAADVVDLVLLKEELDPAGELVGNLTRASDHFFPVIGETLNVQAELGGAVGEGVVELGIFEERLGRDTTPVEAGATGAIVLDTGDFFSELGGADCSDISAGAATNDNKIVRCHE